MTLEAPVPTRAKRPRHVAVQLNTRVSLTTRELIDDIAEREEITIRDVIETAILDKWGTGQDQGSAA